MSLALYGHPFSSYTQKVLIALYENSTPFEPRIIDLGDPAQSAELKALWPIRKFPVLRDEATDRTVPESSIIIEYLDRHYPGGTRLIPVDPELARQTRLLDRFFDLHLHLPMQKIVGDRLRPADRKDAFGVDQAKAQMQTALDMVDRDMATRTWAAGDTFGMADCAAAPVLYYSNRVLPFASTHRNASAYLERLDKEIGVIRRRILDVVGRHR